MAVSIVLTTGIVLINKLLNYIHLRFNILFTRTESESGKQNSLFPLGPDSLSVSLCLSAQKTETIVLGVKFIGNCYKLQN